MTFANATAFLVITCVTQTANTDCQLTACCQHVNGQLSQGFTRTTRIPGHYLHVTHVPSSS